MIPRPLARATAIGKISWPQASRSATSHTLRVYRRFRTCSASYHTERSPKEASGKDLGAIQETARRTHSVLISHNALQTRPLDLLSKIAPVPSFSAIDAHNADVVVLLSKGFAHWLNDGTQILSDAVNRLFSGHGPAFSAGVQKVNLLVAVVDRIPAPSSPYVTRPDRSSAEEQASRAQWMYSPPVHEHGFDGLAYIVAQEGALVTLDDPSHSTPVTSEGARLRDIAPAKLGSILFRFYDASRPTEVSTSLEIALANTIFSNASEYILNGSVWNRDPVSGKLQQTSIKQYKNVSVSLPFGTVSKLSNLDSSSISTGVAGITIPLQPLTPPRKVSASMGNVIRGIEGAEHGASKELEDAVSQYFIDQDIEPQTAAVWALIIPKHLQQAISSQPDDSSHPETQGLFHRNPASQLWRGATLHKVLSGGGGWGKKAGLLSLDPDEGFGAEAASENAREQAALSEENDFLPNFGLLRDVFSPGDSIQFFIAPDLEQIPQGEGKAQREQDPDRLSSIDFGVIPSTVDDMPTEAAQTEQEGPDMIQKFVGHFGALSEAGLSLVRQPSSPKPGPVSRTKIDVPFSRFKLQLLKENVRD